MNRFTSVLLLTIILLSVGRAEIPADSLIEKFLYSIQYGLAAGDAEALNQHIKMDKLLDKSLHGLAVTKKMEQELKSEFNKQFNFGAEIIQGMGEDGHYMAMNYDTSSDTIRALFRLAGMNIGVNYHQFDIIYDRDFEIIDVYIYLSGEYLSDTFRILIEPMLLNTDSFTDYLKSMGEQIFGEKRRYINELPKLAEMKQARIAGDFQKAHEIYLSMASSVQKMKAVQLLHIICISNISNDLMVEYVEKFRDSYPDDPSLDLLLIDYFLVKQDYKSSLAALHRLSQNVGEDDGYLHYMMGNIYYAQKEFGLCEQYQKMAIELEPWLAEPHYQLIELYLENRNFSGVVAMMVSLEENAGMAFSDDAMQANELFSEFLKSDAYKQWRTQ